MQTAIQTSGYAAHTATSPLAPFVFERREPGARDVLIDIAYCGVCHSDVHQARDEWGNTVWPCLPGHEIVGTVRQAGDGVTKFKTGDVVGVGCMVDSCRTCEACRGGEEQYCEGPHSFTATYNGPMLPDGSNTFGGYSTNVVVSEDFVLRIPKNMDPQSAAPLLCSGVTTYSPMKHFGVGAGKRIGIVGVGGLGHVAIQIAKALGAEVVAFTRSPGKLEDAKRFGAIDAVLSTDEKAMERYARSLDYILSTVPEPHDVNPYIALLKRDGRLTLVGVLAPLEPGVDNSTVAFHRISLGGSLIGSIAETQEILDFCALHGIASQTELIPIDRINAAFDDIVAGTVRYRYVIDGSSLQA